MPPKGLFFGACSAKLPMTFTPPKERWSPLLGSMLSFVLPCNTLEDIERHSLPCRLACASLALHCWDCVSYEDLILSYGSPAPGFPGFSGSESFIN